MYKVVCERHKTTDIAKNMIEVEYLKAVHDRKYRCLEAEHQRFGARG